jgi:hypothetical protein
MKLDKLKGIASKPAKIEEAKIEEPIKANIDIIAEQAIKMETLDDVMKKLSEKFMLGDVYLFLDLDVNKYVIINYNSMDKFENLKMFDKQTIGHLIKSMLTSRMKNKEVEFFPFSKVVMNNLISSVQGVKKSFNREMEEFFTDSDYLPTLNLFKRTPLIEYTAERQIDYNELKSILEAKYKRLNILLKNNIGNDKEIEWFLNWIAMELNRPEDIKTTFIIIGEQGSGKSILVEEIFKENIYHFSNVSILDNKTIKDNFNDIYNYKSFIIMNEVSTVDLKENNQIAQDLKRLITDGSYINRGMFKSGVEKKKTFNISLTTNKDKPVQIEQGDRRFSVFGRGKKLLEMKEIKELNENFDNFIDNVKIEIRDFLYFVKALNFNPNVAIDPIMTELKKKIISTTNTKDSLMVSYFNTRDYESMEILLKQFEFQNEELFYTKFKKMFEIGIFTNDILFQIYTAIFEIEVNDFNHKNMERTSGAFWGKLLVKPAKPLLKIDGVPTNIKVFEDKEIDTKKDKLKMLFSDIKKDIPIFYEDIKKELEEIDENEEMPF